ncbi:MAG TPA: MarR family transcriptional regulator, partial [Ktedonobacteraceae bacterium]|nr:MarR family transcriptional regulator [Ktedonobacteraceae bacterium]
MDALEDTLFQHLAYACSETRQSFDQHIGMSQARRHLLTLLEHAGEISHAALQQRLVLDGATITRLVKQFESEGVLSRRLDPQNNRYTLVSLTASGHSITAGLRAAHSAFQ